VIEHRARIDLLAQCGNALGQQACSPFTSGSRLAPINTSIGSTFNSP
jgi:hypothetical protein